MDSEQPNVLPGFCQCGCGTRFSAPLTRAGKPRRFLTGHHLRKSPVDYIEDPETSCWIWQLSLDDSGYGRVNRDGTQMPGLATRWYYERAKGPVPEGLDLDHLCRNRGCVNPDHLEPVTRGENLRRGITTKLNWEKVGEIRASDESCVELAKRFGVSPETISHARTGRTWREAV